MSTIKLKRGSTDSWESQNPILSDGQPGVERTSGGGVNLKVGDGSTAWNDLGYVGEGQYLPLSGGTMTGHIRMSRYSVYSDRILRLGGYDGIQFYDGHSGVSTTGTAPTRVRGVATPTDNNDAANKSYVDTQVNSKLSLSGGTLTGTLKLSNIEASSVYNGLKIKGGNTLTLQSSNGTGLTISQSGVDLDGSAGYVNITSDSSFANRNYIRIGSDDEKIFARSLEANYTAVSIGHASENTLVYIGNSSTYGDSGNVFLTGIRDPSNDRDAVPYYCVGSKHWEFSFAPYGGGTLTASIRSFGKVVFFTIRGVLNIGSSAPSSGTFSEITIPADYRPAYPVSIPVVEVSDGAVYGHTDRFTIGTDGSLSYVFANNGALERNCSACWVSL